MKLGVRIADKIIEGVGKTFHREWKYEIAPEVLNFIQENKGKVKAIMIVGPHTSNWDVFHGIRFQQEHPEFKGLFRTPGKKSLFTGVKGFFLKGILEEYGGHELDRSKGRKYLDDIVETIIESEEYIWNVYPEGTRSSKRFKKGFILGMKKLKARGKPVPLILCCNNYKEKMLSAKEIISHEILDSGDLALWEKVEIFYTKDMAKHPENYNENIIPENVKNNA